MPSFSDVLNALRLVQGLSDVPAQTRLNQAMLEDQARIDRQQETISIIEAIRQEDAELRSSLSRFAEYFSELPIENKLFIAAGVGLIGASFGALIGAISLGIAAAESLYILAGYLLRSHHHSEIERFNLVTEAVADAEQQLEDTLKNVKSTLDKVRTASNNVQEIALKADACTEELIEQTEKINAQVANVDEVARKLDETRVTIEVNNLKLKETTQHIDDSWDDVAAGLTSKIDTLGNTDTHISEACTGLQQSNAAINTIQENLGDTTRDLNDFLNRLKTASTQRLVALDEKKKSADKLAEAMSKLDERFVESRRIIQEAEKMNLIIDKEHELAITNRLITADSHKKLILNYENSLEKHNLVVADNEVADQEYALARKKNDELNAKFEDLMNTPNRRRATTHQITFFSASTEESETAKNHIPRLAMVK